MPAVELTPPLPAFLLFQEQLGYVPNLFRMQANVPGVLEAEAALMDAALFSDTALTRIQKERLLAAVAGALGNSYSAPGHVQMLRLLGLPEEGAIAVASDFRLAPLAAPDRALLRFGAGLAAFGSADPAALGAAGLDGEAILLDAAIVTALGVFLSRLAAALGPQPDFTALAARLVPAAELCPEAAAAGASEASSGAAFADPAATLAARPAVRSALDRLRGELAGSPPNDEVAAACQAALSGFLDTLVRVSRVAAAPAAITARNIAHPEPPAPRLPMQERPPGVDPDAGLVAAARQGDADAFEQLVERHGRRVYRTLAAILGDPEEARDAVQDTFLKAFHRLGSFEERSKFSTWLVSIGVNAALQRLRERRPLDSLDETGMDADETFRPRLGQAWMESPEQRYAKLELKELVEREVRRLPIKYRTVVVLRDLEQLSTEEAAGALGLGIPALKARLLRARLLLREALSPHFAAAGGGVQ